MTTEKDEAIDPLALALFGVRDHVRHHYGCAEKRGIAGHHYDEADDCALRDIIKRYGDARAAERVIPPDQDGAS